MVGAAYAAVPLYNWFCKTTGFGGTTQVADQGTGSVSLDRTLTIRFDSNVTSGLPWRFEPEQNAIQVRIGEVATVDYKVVNEARARDRSAGFLQCFAADRWRVFRQDQLLLLHRAAPRSQARRARCRWCSTSIRRSLKDRELRTTSTRSRCPTTFYAAARAGKPVADRGGSGDERTRMRS